MKLQATPHRHETVEQACAEACALANRLQVSVAFEYNSIPLEAWPGNAPMDLVEVYKDKLR